jgi:hypothetical protein
LLLDGVGDGHVVGERAVAVIHARRVTRGSVTKTSSASVGRGRERR